MCVSLTQSTTSLHRCTVLGVELCTCEAKKDKGLHEFEWPNARVRFVSVFPAACAACSTPFTLAMSAALSFDAFISASTAPKPKALSKVVKRITQIVE